MKPKEKKPDTVYRIIQRDTGKAQGVYSRAYCDEYDFNSPSQARNSNCNDIHKDKDKYSIAKYRVIYELIDPDCDDDADGVIERENQREADSKDPMQIAMKMIVEEKNRAMARSLFKTRDGGDE